MQKKKKVQWVQFGVSPEWIKKICRQAGPLLGKSKNFELYAFKCVYQCLICCLEPEYDKL